MKCIFHKLFYNYCILNIFLSVLKMSLICGFFGFVLFFAVCDYMGEKLASLFGITTPKYQYAIDEYYRIKKEVQHHVTA